MKSKQTRIIPQTTKSHNLHSINEELIRNTYVTIPTAGNKAELLENIISNSGLPRRNFIIVSTKVGSEPPPGVVVIEDFDNPNIHRWWNSGIQCAEALGADFVAVLNDDLSINNQTIPLLVQAMKATNACVASRARIGQKPGLHKNITLPYREKILGALWVLDVKSSVRPDLSYTWYYGDVELDIQARKSKSGLVTEEVFFQHHHAGIGTKASDYLFEKSRLDSILFTKRHPWVSRFMVATGVLDSFKKKFKKNSD
jgi:GT2 family glycosyltransferase